VRPQTALGDGALACRELTRRDDMSQIVRSLQGRHLTAFEAYVVTRLGATYLCPAELPRETAVMEQALLGP